MVSATSILIEGIAGALTNAYGPSSFTANPSFWQFALHWYFGYAVGVIDLVLIVLAVRSGNSRFVALAAVTLLAVAAAGASGMLFVRSSPNDQTYSIAMAVSFAVAFVANVILNVLIGRQLRTVRPGSPTVAASP